MGPVQGGPQQKIASLHTKTRKKQINDKDYNRHWKVYTHKHITKYNIKKTGVNGVSNQKTLVARTRHHTEFGSTQMVHLHRMNI